MAKEVNKAISPAIEWGLCLCCDTEQQQSLDIYYIKTALSLWTITVIMGYTFASTSLTSVIHHYLLRMLHFPQGEGKKVINT